MGVAIRTVTQIVTVLDAVIHGGIRGSLEGNVPLLIEARFWRVDLAHFVPRRVRSSLHSALQAAV